MENIKKNKIIFLAVLVFGLAVFGVAKIAVPEREITSQKPTENYYGEWVPYKFTSPSIVGESSGFIEPDKINDYLQKEIDLKDTSSIIFDHLCKDLIYSKSHNSSYDYLFDNYKVVRDQKTGSTTGLMKEMLGIGTDFTDIIEIVCDNNYYVFFVLNPKEALIEYKNTFFFLQRK